ncbi:MAG TPA: RHS repeat-associated core domain-containing protein [Blastocatellia bacterium]|nr:RHS repeat-associated core domain-containing protein [Blastocatellia bacterium]
MTSTAGSLKLRTYLRLYLIAAIILGLQALAVAQNAARPDRGVRPNGSYAVSDIESVNLVNGNLNLSIPLASLPPVAGGKISFSINATYNSKITDVYRSEIELKTIPPTRYVKDTIQPSSEGGWKIGGAYAIVFRPFTSYDFGWLGPETTDTDYNFFIQNPPSSWFKVQLLAPDGATHELTPIDYTPYLQSFRPFLWSYYRETPDKLNPPAAIRYYTSDGSYIWAKVHPSSSSTKWEVYLPDGTRIIQTASFQRIEDTNGNSIKIFTEDTGLGSLITHYQDEEATSTVREIRHKITFGSPNEHIEYQTVTGSLVQTTVVWADTFVRGQTYNNSDHNSNNQVCEQIDQYDATMGVIERIILPQTEAGVEREFSFDYSSDTAMLIPGVVFTDCDSPGQQFQVPATSPGWGTLSVMRMPSGARVDYTYFLDGDHHLFTANEAPRDRIISKTITHDAVIDTWTYSPGSPQATVVGPDGMRVSEFAYTTDPAFAPIYGGPGGLGGLVYKTIRHLNLQPHVTVERHWRRLLFNGGSDLQPGTAQKSVFNAVVDAEYTTLHDAAGNPLKMSAKTFLHDYNGNVIEERCYDWFDPALINPYRDPNNVNLPTQVPPEVQQNNLLRVATNSYHNQADGAASTNVYSKRVSGNPLSLPTPYILSAPKESIVSNSASVLATTRFHYDGLNFVTVPTKGNVTKERRDNGGVWVEINHTYDSKGNRTSTTDPRGNITQFFYEDQTLAQPTRVVVDPNNQVAGDEHTTLVTYDYHTGLVTSQTDPNQKTTTTDYFNPRLAGIDPYGRPGLVTGPFVTVNVGGVTSTQRRKVVTKYFDSLRQVEVWSDLNAEGDAKLRTRARVDQLGRPVLSETSEDGVSYSITSETVYEQMGRITYTSNPRRSTPATTDGWTRATSDDMGRVVEVATFSGATRPSATSTSWNGRVTSSFLANETTVTDQDSKKRKSVVDGLGRLVKVYEDPLGLNYETSYTYDALGNLTRVNQGSQVREFTYDTLSRLRTAKNPEQVNSSGQMVATVYSYDDASNLTLRSNPNVTSVGFTYDGLNRVKTKTLSTGNTWVYTYDSVTNGKGRPTSSVKQGSTDGYYYDGYDAMGRVTSSRQITTSDAANTYTMSYGYDLAGNLTSQVYPSGKEYRTSYDSAGREASVSRHVSGLFDKTYASQFSYAAHGAVTGMTLGNNATRESTIYNSRLQTEQIELRKVAGNALILGLDYTYGTNNNNGNLRTQAIRTGATTFNQTYGYDGLNRLTSASEAGWSQTYDYDRYGNRWVSQSIGYTVDPTLTPRVLQHYNAATNRISMNGYTYDISGNQFTQVRNSINETYGYDSENRMTSLTSGAGSAGYAYDGEGRRVKKVVAGTTTTLVYNAGGQLIAEYQSGVVQPPQGGGGTTYLTSDHLGSTRVVTKPDATVKARHDYLPFGEEIGAGVGGRDPGAGYGQADGVRQKFTSEERDNESGLDYFGARYFSSAQGRFISPDEFTGGPEELYHFAEKASANPTFYSDVSNPQSLNKYQYCYSNPLRYVDRDGHDPSDPDPQKNKKKKDDQEPQTLHLPAGPLIPIAAEALTVAITPEIAAIALIFGAELAYEGNINFGSADDAPVVGSDFSAIRIPDKAIIVRGGATNEPPLEGEKFSGAFGLTVYDASKGVPHGKVSFTTAGKIRADGGTVVYSPEYVYRHGPLNFRHVNITLGKENPFEGPIKNPVAEVQRIRGRSKEKKKK